MMDSLSMTMVAAAVCRAYCTVVAGRKEAAAGMMHRSEGKGMQSRRRGGASAQQERHAPKRRGRC